MTDRHATRKFLKIVIISFVILCILGYTGYEIQKVIFGPRITVSYPKNDSTVSDSYIEVTGMAKNITSISMDDRSIFVDQKGNFNEEILLSPGYNAVTIKASDKFGRNTEKVIEVIYK
jgi:hypothetical protein